MATFPDCPGPGYRLTRIEDVAADPTARFTGAAAAKVTSQQVLAPVTRVIHGTDGGPFYVPVAVLREAVTEATANLEAVLGERADQPA